LSSAQSHKSSPANPFAIPTDYPTPSPTSASLSRRQSAFSRLKSFSRTPIDHLPQSITRTRHPSHPKHKVEVNTLRLDFPQPPTHIPTPIASAHGASVRSSAPPFLEATPIEDTSSIFFSLDPFRSEFVLENHQIDHPIESLPEDRLPSTGRSPSPSPSATKTVKGSGRRTSLKRLKTATKEALLATLRTPVSELSSTYSVKGRRARSLLRTSESTVAPESLQRDSPTPVPVLVFDNTELTASPSSEPDLSLQPPISRQSLPEDLNPVREDLPVGPGKQTFVPANEPTFASAFQLPPPAVRYEFVDPSELTASPFSFANSLLNASTRTSFIPPSPSWLSRNVQPEEPFDFLSILPSPASQGRTPYLFDLERLRPSPIDSEPNSPCVLFRPDSPPPLPIPPPIIIVPPPQPRSRTESIVIEGCPERDPDSVSVGESTLTTESCPASLRTSSSRTVPISARASISSPSLSQHLSRSPTNKRPSFSRKRYSTTESKRRSRSIVTHSFRSSFEKDDKSSVSFHEDTPEFQRLKSPTPSAEARNSNISTTAIFNLDQFSDIRFLWA